MKTIIKTSVIIIALLLALTSNANDDVNGRKNADAVIFSETHVPRLVEDMPEGWYYHDTRMLTIEFPTTGFVRLLCDLAADQRLHLARSGPGRCAAGD